MKLNTVDRITLLSMLVRIKTANFWIYDEIERVMSEASISADEVKELKIKELETGGLNIPVEAMKVQKEVNIPEIIITKVIEVIEELDKSVRPTDVVKQEYSLLKALNPEYKSTPPAENKKKEEAKP